MVRYLKRSTQTQPKVPLIDVKAEHNLAHVQVIQWFHCPCGPYGQFLAQGCSKQFKVGLGPCMDYVWE